MHVQRCESMGPLMAGCLDEYVLFCVCFHLLGVCVYKVGDSPCSCERAEAYEQF